MLPPPYLLTDTSYGHEAAYLDTESTSREFGANRPQFLYEEAHLNIASVTNPANNAVFCFQVLQMLFRC